MARKQPSIEQIIADHNRRIAKPLQIAQLLLPLLVIGAGLAIHYCLADALPRETDYYSMVLCFCLLLYGALFLVSCCIRELRVKMLHASWYIAMLFFLLACYDIFTLKTGYLTANITVDPEVISASFFDNGQIVLESTLASLLLLAQGLVWGLVSGVLSGVLIGWSYYGNYWLSPLLKIIGPVPSAVWLPISLIIMPSSHAASVFVISLAVWFPVALSVGTAIENTDKRFVEAARCMGASKLDILFRIAVPSALPAFFTGAFMGLSASFGALVFAEMLGVESGLGWYLMASRQLFSFGRVWCAVIIFIVVFSLLTTLLFKIRDTVLKWQKGYIAW